MTSSNEEEQHNFINPTLPLSASDRGEELKEAFAARFKIEPDFYVRVPGRVNLIGEHIDYCGYGVCPMALKQDVLMAVAEQNERSLKLSNINPNYADYKCDLKNISIDVGGDSPKWYQYFLCGVKGIFEILPKDSDKKGFCVLIGGVIPQSAGLSSSSALVCAAALATAAVHKFPMSREKIANLCAECERYIGTQGGGMDQAIAFLATSGCAKLIEFSPLRSKDVTLPAGAVFVIAHSLVQLNKAATADYNCRVVECRLAAQLIAKKRGLDWTKIRKLGELQQTLTVDLIEMISLVEKVLHEEPYSKDEILRELETTSDHLDEVSLTPNTKHIRSFKLRQRALHVYQEANRVQQFHAVCTAAGGEGALETLGRLMSESHDSLRDLYECSHPQLDRVIELSKGVALGARLTGAGWGGCIVALLSPENVDKYISTLKEKFYKPLGAKDDLESLVFATSPNSGACVYTAK